MVSQASCFHTTTLQLGVNTRLPLSHGSQLELFIRKLDRYRYRDRVRVRVRERHVGIISSVIELLWRIVWPLWRPTAIEPQASQHPRYTVERDSCFVSSFDGTNLLANVQLCRRDISSKRLRPTSQRQVSPSAAAIAIGGQCRLLVVARLAAGAAAIRLFVGATYRCESVSRLLLVGCYNGEGRKWGRRRVCSRSLVASPMGELQLWGRLASGAGRRRASSCARARA